MNGSVTSDKPDTIGELLEAASPLHILTFYPNPRESNGMVAPIPLEVILRRSPKFRHPTSSPVRFSNIATIPTLGLSDTVASDNLPMPRANRDAPLLMVPPRTDPIVYTTCAKTQYILIAHLSGFKRSQCNHQPVFKSG